MRTRRPVTFTAVHLVVLLISLLGLSFLAGVVYVVWHFISKFW